MTDMSNVTTPLPNVIEKALRNLLPTEVPDYSADDLEYLAGVTAADLMATAFPEESRIISHTKTLGLDPHGYGIYGNPICWTKSANGVFFVLARRTPDSEECMLLRVTPEEYEQIRPAIEAKSAPSFLRAVRELPPTCLIGYHPTVDQGLIALDKAHTDGPAVEKTLEAMVLHCQIMRNAAETVAGLAKKLLDLRPDDGAVKLVAVTDPKNLARATEEARHALDVRSPKPLLGKSNAAD